MKSRTYPRRQGNKPLAGNRQYENKTQKSSIWSRYYTRQGVNPSTPKCRSYITT